MMSLSVEHICEVLGPGYLDNKITSPNSYIHYMHVHEQCVFASLTLTG